MRSITLFTALALVSSQLVASAPPSYDERNVDRVTVIVTKTRYVAPTNYFTQAAPPWMQGNNPWGQYGGKHPHHGGQQPNGKPEVKPTGSNNGNSNSPGKKGKPGNNGGGNNHPTPTPIAGGQKPPTGNGGSQPTKKPGKPPGNGGHKTHKHPQGGQPTPPSKSSSKKPQPPKSSSKPQPSANAGYQGEVLQCHNVHRANHSAPALTWSSSLAATAQQIAETCNYGHSMGVGGAHYGQNIAAGVGPDEISKVISNMFYNHEEPYFNGQYGNPHPTGFEKWGHFSQVVWKKTSQVGCHTCDCSSKGGLKNTGGNVKPYFTVCNYAGPGNIAGQYAVNIGKPLGHPTVYG